MFQNIESRRIGIVDRHKIYDAARGNTDFIQRLRLERKLEVHTGCVNTISWNERGTNILSGSDDQHLIVTNPYNGRIIHKIRSGHRQNIFSAKFLPSCNDSQTVSCSGDGKIFYTNLDRDDTYGTFLFDCHFGTAYEVIVIPNEASTFLSCGEDGTVRFFDLRAKTTCTKRSCKDDVLISCRSALTALAANPMLPWQLGIGCSDSSVRIYDRRMLGTRATGNYTGKGVTGLMSSFTPPSLERESYRVTSLNFSPDGKNALVSYSSEFIYLFGTDNNEDVTELKKNVPLLQEEAEPIIVDEPLASSSTPAVEDDVASRAPPVKRLRLRGDWSDTGPRARPERDNRPPSNVEGAPSQPEAPPGGSRAAIMNRMSDLLTRWLYGNMRQGQGQQDGEATAEPNPSQQEVGASHTEAIQPSAEGIENQASENAESSETTGSAESSNTGTKESIEDGERVDSTQSGVGNDTCSISLKHEQDSSDSKSDESQSSFVNKIETMNVEDGDSNSPVESSAATDTDTVTLVATETSEHDRKWNTPKLTVENTRTDLDNVIYNPLEPNLFPDYRTSRTDEESDSVQKSAGHLKQSRELDTAELVENPIKESLLQESRSVSETEDVLAERIEESSSGLSDDEPPYMVETGQYRETVSTAVNSLRAHNVKPVVSLHYSPEGTSASMIKVGFTSFQSLEDEIAEQNPHLVQNRNIDNRSEMIQTSLNGSVNNDSDSATAEPINESNETVQRKEEESIKNSENNEERMTPKVQDKTSDLAELNSDKSIDFSDCGKTNNHDKINDNNLMINQGACAMETDDCDSSGGFKPFSVKAEDNSHQLLIDEGTSAAHGKVRDSALEVPSCSYSVNVQAEADTPSTSTRGEEAGARPRQRRVGHSGPPTGTFQLPGDTGSSHGDSSSSEDDDSRPDPPTRRTDFERTTAALKLQAMHRLRQEAKEKKEMETKNVFMPKVKRVYKGHRNARTMIKESNFWGDQFVLSGSDCGHVFIWDRNTAKVVMLLEADKHVVNCIQPHPYDMMLATSGIDYDVKIWAPLNNESLFDEERAKEVIRRNELMLEETRDTITVPAAFMLRVLASINSIRSGRRAAERNNAENPDSPEEQNDGQSP